MNHSHLLGTRKHLASQLVFFDEQLPLFLDTYFQEYNKERQQVDRLIKDYINRLESVLTGDDQALEQSLASIALMGSSITVNYIEDGMKEEYTIVYPTEADADRGRLSFLSPIGRQLLCKSLGDEIVVDGPVDQYRVRIDQIKYSYIGGFTEV
jgi:transcription elongation GreA/GreB family factor